MILEIKFDRKSDDRENPWIEGLELWEKADVVSK